VMYSIIVILWNLTSLIHRIKVNFKYGSGEVVPAYKQCEEAATPLAFLISCITLGQ
jgi:hypothetical protein